VAILEWIGRVHPPAASLPASRSDSVCGACAVDPWEAPVSHPSAREVVTRYLDVLYNERRLDLIPELIADPTWRHHAGEVKSLSLAESIARLEATLDLCPVLHFDTALMHDGDDMVTVAWNGRSTQKNGKSYTYCGIEIFRVSEGKIVEIWNSRETGGHWESPQTL
jgi:predicted SnoaL-like aldol condensation-catalyzing enzyme